MPKASTISISCSAHPGRAFPVVELMMLVADGARRTGTGLRRGTADLCRRVQGGGASVDDLFA